MLIISVIATADLVEVKLVKQLIRTGQLSLLKEKKRFKINHKHIKINQLMTNDV